MSVGYHPRDFLHVVDHLFLLLMQCYHHWPVSCRSSFSGLQCNAVWGILLIGCLPENMILTVSILLAEYQPLIQYVSSSKFWRTGKKKIQANFSSSCLTDKSRLLVHQPLTYKIQFSFGENSPINGCHLITRVWVLNAFSIVGEGLDTCATFESRRRGTGHFCNVLKLLEQLGCSSGRFRSCWNVFWKSSAMFGDSWNIFKNEVVWKWKSHILNSGKVGRYIP